MKQSIRFTITHPRFVLLVELPAGTGTVKLPPPASCVVGTVVSPGVTQSGSP